MIYLKIAALVLALPTLAVLVFVGAALWLGAAIDRSDQERG